MLRILLMAALALGSWPVQAAAQEPMGIHMGRTKKPPTPEEREKRRKIDEAYQAATSRIPDKKVDDPWAGVRPGRDTPRN